MQNKLKVLHVIPSVSPSRGGPSKAVIEMVAALQETDLDIEIATTNDNGVGCLDVPLNSLIEHQGVPVRFFKRFSPPINALREFAYSSTFKSWIKKHIKDYDLVHVHAIFSFCSSYTMVQARKQGVDYIVRPIGQLEDWSLTQSANRKRLYLSFIERRNLITAKAVHFTAESEKAQALKNIPELKGPVIPLGLKSTELIDDATQKMRARWGLKDGVPTLVFLSRLHPKKGLEELITSLSQLNTQFQLVIAGNGEAHYINALKTSVMKHGLSEQCKFIGFVEGVDKNLLLQGADLFTLTSHSENFGIAVLEAMASNTAVLISQEVALSEHVEQHKLGYVTSLDQQSITDTLQQALSQLDVTKTMGDNARNFALKNYKWSVISQKVAKLYNTCL